jgi:molybdenum cofactor guanylyltransferase
VEETPTRGPADPIGVVLAGGSGRRIGGGKATVQLQGRPLIAYPLEALAEALGEVAVICKVDTELPTMSGVTVWIEPPAPRHPLVGIRYALALAEGRSVFVCAADLPLVTPEVVRRICLVDPGQAPAVIAAHGGRMQPLLGRYDPGALEWLRRVEVTPEVTLRDAVAGMEPLLVDVADPDAFFNVNTPDDLLQAAAMMDRRRAAAATRPRAAGGA